MCYIVYVLCVYCVCVVCMLYCVVYVLCVCYVCVYASVRPKKKRRPRLDPAKIFEYIRLNKDIFFPLVEKTRYLTGKDPGTGVGKVSTLGALRRGNDNP